jgi:hypothetical protein
VVRKKTFSVPGSQFSVRARTRLTEKARAKGFTENCN